MPISRREWMLGAAAGAGLALPARALATTANDGGANQPPLPAMFNDLEHRTFRFFWERTNARNGLVPDRWPSPGPSGIAAIGFGLTAYPIGVERGWITRAQARERTLTTLRFLHQLPTGEARTGVAGHRGFFYHFLDMETGLRVGEIELSTVDTALMHMGMLFAAGWFDGTDDWVQVGQTNAGAVVTGAPFTVTAVVWPIRICACAATPPTANSSAAAARRQAGRTVKKRGRKAAA